MTDLLKKLNETQQKAASSDNQHILILAGAGSGKTRTLTHRIAYLISKRKVKPNQILAVTFTNKAAREMKERLVTLVGTKISQLWIGTFHSVCARILRIDADALGMDKNFTIYDTDDQVRAIKKVMSKLNIAQQQFAPKLIQNRISRAKNQLLKPDDLEESATDELSSMLPAIYKEYQAFLKENNAMDFDDLLINPIELFKKKPDILKNYRSRFQHVLIDEYQDTNKAQYSLIQTLVGKDLNLCVVGDEDQSIYRWRGADINNILNFNKDFPQAAVFRLEENYRSNENILSGASALVANNEERLGKTLWTKREGGDPIVIMDAENEREEAKKLIEGIHNEMFTKKRSFKDIAILYRTNAQSRVIEDELRRNAINYTVIGGRKFYERKEIKDILAYLKVVVNPKDSVSLRRIINFPLRGVGETTVGKIEKFAEAEQISLLEGMGRVSEIPSISAGMGGRVLEFFEIITKYRELSQEISAAELASTMTTEVGIINHLKTEYDQYESESRLQNVYELFNTIEEFTKEREADGREVDLASFLEDVSLQTDVDGMKDDANQVTMMTLHAAKGLEFPVVFITGLEMGLFPLQRNQADPAELEEERRLLYVGMTRAEENLYLSYAQSRRRLNAFVQNVPSLFVDEIPAKYVKFKLNGSRKRNSTPKTKSQARRKKMMSYFKTEDHSQEQGPGYSVGSGVYHATFGKGKIVDLEGHGDKMKISVLFEGNVLKKLIAQYANLTPLEIAD